MPEPVLPPPARGQVRFLALAVAAGLGGGVVAVLFRALSIQLPAWIWPGDPNLVRGVAARLAADPRYAAAHNLRGLIYLRLNQPALAQTSFEQALRLAPQDADVLHNLGWLHCQQARYPEAQRHFERA